MSTQSCPLSHPRELTLVQALRSTLEAQQHPALHYEMGRLKEQQTQRRQRNSRKRRNTPSPSPDVHASCASIDRIENERTPFGEDHRSTRLHLRNSPAEIPSEQPAKVIGLS